MLDIFSRNILKQKMSSLYTIQGCNLLRMYEIPSIHSFHQQNTHLPHQSPYPQPTPTCPSPSHPPQYPTGLTQSANDRFLSAPGT